MSFDVDWMRGQSVGIYPISNSAPEPIIAELEKIMDSGDNGLSQNVVKFQPISRLNAILVVSQQADAAAHRRNLDQAARSCRHRREPAFTSTGEIWRRPPDRASADRHVRRRLVQSCSIVRTIRLAPGSGNRDIQRADRLSFERQSLIVGFIDNQAALARAWHPERASAGRRDQVRPSGRRKSATAGRALEAPSSGGNGQPLLQDVRITPDIVNNTLLIYADQGNYRIIEATLDQVDQPQLQVAIDATIAEVTLTNELSATACSPS